MIYDFTNYKKLVCIGDMHTQLHNIVPSIEKMEDTLIVCTGDIPLGIDKFEFDVEHLQKYQYKLSKNNNRLLIIRGNHDNPKYFKEKSTFRELLSEETPNIDLVPDYSIIQMCNHNILCIGGARSIDKLNRVKNYNWWQNEAIQKPSDNFYNDLTNKGISIDIVISHAAPLFAQPLEFSNELKYYNSYFLNACALYDNDVKNDVYKERLLLKGIYDKLNNKNHIKYYIYGHYHKSIDSVYSKTKMISLGFAEIKNILNE